MCIFLYWNGKIFKRGVEEMRYLLNIIYVIVGRDFSYYQIVLIKDV